MQHRSLEGNYTVWPHAWFTVIPFTGRWVYFLRLYWKWI